MSGLKVKEESKWGNKTAYSRYGRPPQVDMKPRDMSAPQFPEDKRAADRADDRKNDWVRGFGKNGQESAETMPNFDARGKGGLPKKW